MSNKDRNSIRKIYFIGNFDDHFYRIHSYINSSAALGLRAEFFNPIEFVEKEIQLQQHDCVIFNDEPSINYFANFSSGNRKVDSRVTTKASALVQFANKQNVRKLFSAEFPHQYVHVSSENSKKEIDFGPLYQCGAIVSKPTMGSCAADVIKFPNIQDAQTHIENRTDEFDLILEEYVEGQHFCLDICWSGQTAIYSGFCWKNMIFGDSPSIVGHSIIDRPPSHLISSLVTKIEMILSSSCNGFASNFHCEFVLIPETEQAKLIEVNPRGPGGWLPELYSISTIGSYDQNLIKNAIGSELFVEEHHTPSALGSVVREEFFDNLLGGLDIKSNTIFEQFPKGASMPNAKLGRFLVWGDQIGRVESDYEAIMAASMPTQIPDLKSLSAALTSSKCC